MDWVQFGLITITNLSWFTLFQFGLFALVRFNLLFFFFNNLGQNQKVYNWTLWMKRFK